MGEMSVRCQMSRGASVGWSMGASCGMPQDGFRAEEVKDGIEAVVVGVRVSDKRFDVDGQRLPFV